MIDYNAIDTTPFANPPFVVNVELKPPTELLKPQEFLKPMLDFTHHQNETSTSNFADTTLTLDELQRQNISSKSQNYHEPSIIERQANIRARLLAQKYEGTLNIEGNARLDLITARLNKLLPRVTDQDLDFLSQGVDKLEKISKSLEQIYLEFNL